MNVDLNKIQEYLYLFKKNVVSVVMAVFQNFNISERSDKIGRMDIKYAVLLL